MPLLDQAAEDEWTTTLFQCCQDPAGSFDATCCFPCQYGRQCEALTGTANTMNWKFCAIAFFCGYFSTCLVCSLRGKIRERFGISGNVVGDCLPSFVCTPCANCLNHRELTNRGYWPGGSICSRAPPGGVG